MNTNERNRILMLGILVIIGFCCIVIVSPVAAVYPNDEWLTNNVTVLANCTEYAYIGEDTMYDETFFAVIGNGQYNGTQPAWNWTMDPNYPSPPRRYYMEQMDVLNSSGNESWYPASVLDGDWGWEFVNTLDMNATIYKRALAGYVNHYPGFGQYYAWYGNKTAAYMDYNDMDNWLVPTYQNATYLVNLSVNWTDPYSDTYCGPIQS